MQKVQMSLTVISKNIPYNKETFYYLILFYIKTLYNLYLYNEPCSGSVKLELYSIVRRNAGFLLCTWLIFASFA